MPNPYKGLPVIFNHAPVSCKGMACHAQYVILCRRWLELRNQRLPLNAYVVRHVLQNAWL